MDILTRKRLLVDIFLTRRLSKSIAFASLRALIWERLTLLDHQFLYWVPCLFRFQSPWASFFFLTRSRLIPEQVHKQRLVLYVVLVLSALRLFSRLSCRKINEYILYNISFHQGVNEESGQKGKGEGPVGERWWKTDEFNVSSSVRFLL